QFCRIAAEVVGTEEHLVPLLSGRSFTGRALGLTSRMRDLISRPSGRRCDMSTTAEEIAVDEVMGRILADLGGALGVLLTALGTRSGLWAALAEPGPLTADEVAAKVAVARPLVREWLAAQAAAGYLDYDPAAGTFTLPEAAAAAVHHGPGGALVDAAATMFSSMGAGFG